MDDDAHQECTTNTGAIDLEEVDMTSCKFPDSDAEEPDLFFADGGAGKRVPQYNRGEHTDGVAEQSVSLDGSSDDEANKRPRFKSFNEATDFKRPIHLKLLLEGELWWELLTTVSKDEYENMYPVAYAVVESQCKDSWQWFLDLLFTDIGTPKEGRWVIMSDIQKGLQPVLESVGCDHRVCVRHLYANFKKLYKDKSLKDGLWNVCKATTMHGYKHHMSVLKSLHVDAHNWLTKYLPNTWSKHTFSPRSKCDILQNNIAETFNSFILDARDKPIITLFEMIRRLLMQRFVVKKEGMENYRGQICPSSVTISS
ncbi:uncharacterized protein G2W53_017583 [Senna tora]|uniref:MULE transposase domain-containing protein n=1 Tax=Senna tora TaxID=362788 RepID=A0A834TRI4_9FABA|nr:uncharacterized protein G2W53_017583 [Senna tora]